MKPIKAFGLAVLMAFIAMAFVGLSSAMAESTTLCKKEENPCSGSNQIKHVHETGTSVINSDIGPLTCKTLFLGDTLSGSNPRVVHGSKTYSSCTSSCTFKEENGPSVVKILRTGSELTSVTSEGLVRVECFFGLIDCSYTDVGLEGHGLGPLSAGPNGAVVFLEQELSNETGSEACPAESFLSIEATPLVATYISS